MSAPDLIYRKQEFHCRVDNQAAEYRHRLVLKMPLFRSSLL